MKAKQAKKGLQGRRFTKEKKDHALGRIASGMDREKVATTVGTTTQSLRRWVEVASSTFRAAMARHGKPEAVRTDRGGGFTAFTKEGDFGCVLEAELVDHIVGKSYNPKGGGKVESAVRTLRRELWDLRHFEDRAEAEAELGRVER